MSAQPTIRVVIVDDQDMVRSGLEIGLSTFEDLQVVGSVGDSQAAVLLCGELRPDVVLMDMMLSGRPDGVVAARAIHAAVPDARMIALSGFTSLDLIKEAFQAGITSYLFKNVSIDELAKTIRAAYEGKAVISPEIAQILNSTGSKPPLSPSL